MSDAPPPAAAGRRSRTRLVALGVAVFLLVGLIGLPVYDRWYHAWPWTTYPSSLTVCGRDFQAQGGAESRARLAAQGYHLVRHGDVPGVFDTAPLWTFDTVNGQPTSGLPGGCHVVMWVQGGRDVYRAYGLEGGP